MNTVEFDGALFIDRAQTHEILKEKLGLPEYYGKNLDALWDCLTGEIDLPLRIIWKNYGASEKLLGDYANLLKTVFEEAQQEIEGLIVEII